MNSVRGLAVSLGGLAWLVGVLILELIYDPSDDELPLSFSVLALLAGVAAGWGCWNAAARLERRVARIGLRSVGVCSVTLGLGFGLNVIPNMFLAFFLSYTVGLFLLPVGFLLLGVGIIGSRIYPTWAKWLPFAVFATAALTYAFHALARDIWDPSDSVWFGALGIGWVVLGLAIASFRIPDAMS